MNDHNHDSGMAFVSHALREGWRVFVLAPFFCACGGFICCVVSLLTAGFLAVPLGLGFMDGLDRIRQGHPADLRLVFGKFSWFLPGLVFNLLLLASLAVIVIVVVSVAMAPSLIYPALGDVVADNLSTGLYALWIGPLSMTAYLLFLTGERRVGEAVRRTTRLLRENGMACFAASLLVMTVSALGFGLFVIGILITGPVANVMGMILFRRLLGLPDVPALETQPMPPVAPAV